MGTFVCCHCSVHASASYKCIIFLPKTFREREHVTAARPRGHAQVLRPAHPCHSRTNVETLSSLTQVRMSCATLLPSLPHRYTALGGSIFHVVFYVTFDCRHMIYSAHLSRHFQVRQSSISAQFSNKGSLFYEQCGVWGVCGGDVNRRRLIQRPVH